jgi:hypothetical protein
MIKKHPIRKVFVVLIFSIKWPSRVWGCLSRAIHSTSQIACNPNPFHRQKYTGLWTDLCIRHWFQTAKQTHSDLMPLNIRPYYSMHWFSPESSKKPAKKSATVRRKYQIMLPKQCFSTQQIVSTTSFYHIITSSHQWSNLVTLLWCQPPGTFNALDFARIQQEFSKVISNSWTCINHVVKISFFNSAQYDFYRKQHLNEATW